MTHAPIFIARLRIVRDGFSRAGTDQLGSTRVIDHGAGAIGLAEISVFRAVVDVAVFFPCGATVIFVKGNNELLVKTVVRHDQKVTSNHWGSTRSSPMIAFQIPALPNHIS